MDTMINWLHMRGLGALALIGLYLVYAWLAGWWQSRKAALCAAGRIKRDQLSAARPLQYLHLLYARRR
jgi:hypothetical protein